MRCSETSKRAAQPLLIRELGHAAHPVHSPDQRPRPVEEIMKFVEGTRYLGLAVALLVACSGVAPEESSDSTQSELRSRTHAKAGNHPGRHGDCGATKSVAIAPDEEGAIVSSSNPLGIHGTWFSYADGLASNGDRGGPCQDVGHADSECSDIFAPNPAKPGFPNVGGTMCTVGTAAQVLLLDGQLDFAHMWGAGMEFELDGGPTGDGAFDARASKVIGLSFDIDQVPAGLRIEVATPTFPPLVGASYWGAEASYPASPVRIGRNKVLFAQVQSPTAPAEPLDVTRLSAIRFFVPGSPNGAQDFSYCISNVRMLIAP
jgi:hypothetical protein